MTTQQWGLLFLGLGFAAMIVAHVLRRIEMARRPRVSRKWRQTSTTRPSIGPKVTLGSAVHCAAVLTIIAGIILAFGK